MTFSTIVSFPGATYNNIQQQLLQRPGKKTKTNLWTNNKAIENLFLETLWNLYYALCLNSIKSGTIKKYTER